MAIREKCCGSEVNMLLKPETQKSSRDVQRFPHGGGAAAVPERVMFILFVKLDYGCCWKTERAVGAFVISLHFFLLSPANVSVFADERNYKNELFHFPVKFSI